MVSIISAKPREFSMIEVKGFSNGLGGGNRYHRRDALVSSKPAIVELFRPHSHLLVTILSPGI